MIKKYIIYDKEIYYKINGSSFFLIRLLKTIKEN